MAFASNPSLAPETLHLELNFLLAVHHLAATMHSDPLRSAQLPVSDNTLATECFRYDRERRSRCDTRKRTTLVRDPFRKRLARRIKTDHLRK